MAYLTWPPERESTRGPIALALVVTLAAGFAAGRLSTVLSEPAEAVADGRELQMCRDDLAAERAWHAEVHWTDVPGWQPGRKPRTP